MRTLISVMAIVALGLTSGFEARSAECASAGSEHWLVGIWRGEFQTMTIRREGGSYLWDFERVAGASSDRWGDKSPAVATGVVEKTEGCRALLKGRYTRYDGPGQKGRPAVGWPMEWKFLNVGPHEVLSEGLGYGREPFKLRWRKVTE